MRIVFMGTPEFAVPSLKVLVDHNYEVICAVTQKDRPKDRGHAIKASPVKEYAVAHNIPVLQPERFSREPEIVEKLGDMEPDLFVTCAFGLILPKTVLDIPKYGTINVHGSLLPKYRGAAPIQRAIINGEKVTGITTMFTDVGVDTGDMLVKRAMEIDENMTYGELHDRMSSLGADTLLETLEKLEEGSLTRIPQDESIASIAPRLSKEDGLIDWSSSSKKIHDLIRGTAPWPGAITLITGSRLKIWSSERVGNYSANIFQGNWDQGEIIDINDSGMIVMTGDGVILIKEIQAESGKRMTPRQYACGHALKAGMTLG